MPPTYPDGQPHAMSRLAAAYRVTERLWWQMAPGSIVLLIAALTVVRAFVANSAGLLWDEPYYWMWSQHLVAGYYDHPPMVAYWIWAGTHLLGDSPLGIRLPFVLNTVATSFAAYGIGRALFGERVGWLALLWTNVSPLLGIAGMMATPDGPSVLFWTLTVFALAMVARTGRGEWWLAVGLFAGLGAMSKYTNLFLGPGILLALLVDPRLRRWFASPWLWAGGVAAIIVFLPVIVWNAGHDWASFRFQFGRVGEARFAPVYFLTLIVVQPLIFNPYAAVFVGRGIRLWLANASPDGPEIGILVATAIPAVAFILFQATHGEVLQHWLAPVFPSLTVAAVAAAATLHGDPDSLIRRIRTDVVPLGLLAALVVWVYALTPLDRFFPGKDPIDSMRGWPAYIAEIEALREKTGARWIATAGYELTAELSFELRGSGTVVPITERARYGFAPSPDPALLGEPALLVFRVGDPLSTAALRCFTTLTEVGAVTRRGAVTALEDARAFLAEGLSPDAFAIGCDKRD
jgi:4-amino-4-deoxy-L-arabinose transferase-like glycosyltransferase